MYAIFGVQSTVSYFKYLYITFVILLFCTKRENVKYDEGGQMQSHSYNQLHLFKKKKLQGVQVSISFGNLRKYCLYIALPLSVDVVYYLCVYCYVHALAHNHAGGRVGFIPRNVPTKGPYEGRRPRFTCALHFTT